MPSEGRGERGRGERGREGREREGGERGREGEREREGGGERGRGRERGRDRKESGGESGREREKQAEKGRGWRGEREEEEAWIRWRDIIMSLIRRLFTSRSKGKGCPSILSSLQVLKDKHNRHCGILTHDPNHI